MFSIPTTYTFLKKWRGHIFFVLYKKYIYNQKKKPNHHCYLTVAFRC